MGYLIDSSIFIAWERAELTVESLKSQHGLEQAALSVISVSELLHGVHRADTAQRRGRREAFVESLIAALPVLPVDLHVARAHSRIWSDLATEGRLMGAHDLLIAATALTHRLKLATRNLREFRRIVGLDVVLW